jgi:hypothetical protein
MKNKILLFSCFLLCFYFSSEEKSMAQDFKTKMLLDGIYDLVYYDLDTTGYWWAITKPFLNTFKIHIEDYESSPFEDISYPAFFPGGFGWAYFGIKNNNVHLVKNYDGKISDTVLDATDYSEITYSPNGEFLAYSYYQGGFEIIQLPFKVIEITNRIKPLFIDNSGNNYAIIIKRLDKFFLNVNGYETTGYDSLLPIGFWHTGEFIYASLNGGTWSIHRGKKELGTSYMKIIDAKINIEGNVFAILVQLFTGRSMAIAFSDKYYEPLYGKTYDEVWGLTLHPSEVLFGYSAIEHNRSYILQNSVEYYASGNVNAPYYTYDGSELISFAMGDFGPYISINGKRFDIKFSMNIDRHIAKKPKSSSFAYTTYTTLLVNYYDKGEFYTGFMCDRMGQAIYNHRSGRYEALGDINNRLYLISCSP